MFKQVLSIILLASSLFFSAASVAESEAEKEVVAQKIKELFTGVGEVEVEESPAKGIYQFWLGSNLNYATYKDGMLMLGELYDTKRGVSLAQEGKLKKTKEIMDSFDESKVIVYGPKKPKRVINVFTDIDCGYCRKLHSEIDQLNDAGIQVRYFAYPRSYGSQGSNSDSYKKYVSVWCSKDRKTALTNAKSGKAVPSADCANPIEETFALGLALGLRGTPFIVLDDGTERGGYVPADKMIQILGLGG